MDNEEKETEQAQGAEDQVAKSNDVVTDMRHIFAQQLQENIHKAIVETTPEGVEPDLPTIIQCLGITASFFGIQAGFTEEQFCEAMSTYCRQARQILGLPVSEMKDQVKSHIILP